MREFLKIVKLYDLTPLSRFQKFCFNLTDSATHEDFSKKVISKQMQDDQYTGGLQDKILNSSEFLELTKDPGIRFLAAELMGVALKDIKIVFPFFRIDLPQKFVDQKKKMSLPWHQEAGYYLAKGDCTPDSMVMSIALHDCKNEQGALNVACDTEKNLVQHNNFFMDEDQKKHLRFECANPEEFIIAETEFGEVVAFDFKRLHRSGTNKSNFVRLTLLLRVTSCIELARFKEDQIGFSNFNTEMLKGALSKRKVEK